ncbi:ABC transporter permease [Spirochaetia bacterium]|nr:ABC transporter permease [Spirochaetia bacterium]
MQGLFQPRGAALFRGWEFRIALITFLLLALLAGAGPFFWKLDPLKTNLPDRLLGPSFVHPLGTDGSGRDLFSRFMHGARISLTSGVVVVCASGIIGNVLGIVAAYFQGITGTVIMRLLDILLSFPQMILAMAISICLGPSLESAVVGISLGCIPVYARLMHSEVMQIRKRQFVSAARLLGFSSPYIFIRHIIPLTAPTMLVQSAAVFGSTIISLSALGFVGLGAQIPAPEWGAMISEGMGYTLSGGWWISLWPGLGLFLSVAAANMLTNALNSSIMGRDEAQ